MRGIHEVPEGLRYLPGFVSDEDQAVLVDHLRHLDYAEVRMHGQVARRTVHHWGVGYDLETHALAPGPALPAWLVPLRRRAADLLAIDPEAMAEALATHYPPGATIGWHRDAPAFGVVVGISLGSPCWLRFQLGTGRERRVHEQVTEPGSAYVLTGPARTRWQHSIPPVPERRWSITFRTIRRGWAPSPRPECEDSGAGDPATVGYR